LQEEIQKPNLAQPSFRGSCVTAFWWWKQPPSPTVPVSTSAQMIKMRMSVPCFHFCADNCRPARSSKGDILTTYIKNDLSL
jgi:hypothetical protein